jgi:hypothetical protein
MKIMLAAFVLFMFSGCATAPPVRVSNALLKAESISDTSSAAHIDAVFYRTLAGCQSVLSGLETQSQNLKWWGAAIQIAGGVAGSIILPALVAAGTAAKSTIAAIGGFAGMTNTAINVVKEEGLGAADVIRTRSNVQANMQTALTKYYAARDAEPLDRGKVAAAISELKVGCVSYWISSPSAAAATPISAPDE